MLCYLAEAMDFADGSDHTASLRGFLFGKGIMIFRPKSAWLRGGTDPTYVDLTNRKILSDAECLIARVSARTVSLGVPMEIEYAADRGIPTFVITDVDDPPSLMLAAKVSAAPESFRVAEYDNRLPSKLEAFLEALPGLPRPAPEPVYPEPPKAVVQFVGERPVRAYPQDAGHDLRAAKELVIGPGSSASIPCGFWVAIPEGMTGWVVARSSTISTHGLLVLPGIVDSGYRGEMMALVWNPTYEAVLVTPGERLAQLILLPNLANEVIWEQADELPSGERGLRGFGSTGRA